MGNHKIKRSYVTCHMEENAAGKIRNKNRTSFRENNERSWAQNAGQNTKISLFFLKYIFAISRFRAVSTQKALSKIKIF